MRKFWKTIAATALLSSLVVACGGSEQHESKEPARKVLTALKKGQADKLEGYVKPARLSYYQVNADEIAKYQKSDLDEWQRSFAEWNGRIDGPRFLNYDGVRIAIYSYARLDGEHQTISIERIDGEWVAVDWGSFGQDEWAELPETEAEAREEAG